VLITIDMTTSPATISLVAPDEFDRFAITVDGDPTPEQLATALEEVGRPADDPQHAFVDAAALIRLAGPLGESPEWREKLEGMTQYARSHGWTDAEDRIRAHIEPAGGGGS
jgi:hypothetical protein